MDATLVAVEEGLGLADDAANPDFVAFRFCYFRVLQGLGREPRACSPGRLGFCGEIATAMATCPGVFSRLPSNDMSNFVPGLPPRSFFGLSLRPWCREPLPQQEAEVPKLHPSLFLPREVLPQLVWCELVEPGCLFGIFVCGIISPEGFKVPSSHCLSLAAVSFGFDHR